MKRNVFLLVLALAFSLCICLSAGAQTSAPDDKIYARGEVDKQVEMLTHPHPRAGESCKQYNSGRVSFNLIFRYTGKVEVGSILQPSPCSSFNDAAYKASESIKFNPAIKDGHAVSVRITVEYNFANY
jgi:TonB family protein